MQLIKRHLISVVLVVMGLVAIGAGVWFMLGKQSAGTAASEQLINATNQIMMLTQGFGIMVPGVPEVPYDGSRLPAPTPENIKVVNDNAQAALDFIAKAKLAMAVEAVPAMTPAAFRIHFIKTLEDLKARAFAARVSCPTNEFEFSFYELKPEVQFVPYTIPALTEQLHDIRNISSVLIQSQVAAIEKIERVSIYPRETKGAPVYLTDLGAYTNSLATVAPYRFTIRCLSGALSRVLTGLGSVPGFCVVKTIEVEPWDPNAPAVAGGMQLALPPRGLPPGVNPPPSIPAVPPGIRPGVFPPATGLPLLTNRTQVARTVLDEKLLRVILVIEINRPKIELPKAGPAAVGLSAPSASTPAPPEATNN